MAEYYKRAADFTSTNSWTSVTAHGNKDPIKITEVYNFELNKLWHYVVHELNETFSHDLTDIIDYGFSFETSSFTNGVRN